MASANLLSVMKPQAHTHTSDRAARVALLALTAAVLTLAFAGVPFAPDGDTIRKAPAAPPRTPTTALSGWLHTLYGDEAAGGGHLHMHLLVDDAGQAAKLAIPEHVIEAAGGRAAV